MSTTLEVAGLSAGYGRIRVVTDVSMQVSAGEIVALVGRNGAGKTTSLAAMAGLRYGPCSGKVVVADTDISDAPAVKVVRSGLSLVREGRRIFRDMTVMENLKLGGFLRRRKEAKEIDADIDRICDLFPPLRIYANKFAGELSGGQQQMVAVGQALVTRPKVLLLDEPASGLAPALVEELYDRLRLLAQDGLGIAIVDQSIERILKWSERFYVFESGRTVLSGKSEMAAADRINAIVLGQAQVGAAPAPDSDDKVVSAPAVPAPPTFPRESAAPAG